MEVEDLLPTGRPVRLREVHAVGRESLIQSVCNALRHRHHGEQVRFRDLPDVGGMGPRDDERVAFGRLTAVEEGDCVIVFVATCAGAAPATIRQKMHDSAMRQVCRIAAANAARVAPTTGTFT